MAVVWPWERYRIRKMRAEEAAVRDARSEEMIKELQKRADMANWYLRSRHKRNHWQEALAMLIDEADSDSKNRKD